MTETPLMPIAPEHRWFYPIDWRELSRVIRLRVPRVAASIVADRMGRRSCTWVTAHGRMLSKALGAMVVGGGYAGYLHHMPSRRGNYSPTS